MCEIYSSAKLCSHKVLLVCSALRLSMHACPDAGLEDVNPGANVDLPIWLLTELAKRDMITIK